MRGVLIPARGNSKRIPGKNMNPFAGSPMISWPIKAAIETGLVQNIYVSTDNQEIAETSQAQGAEIIWRPIDLAGDFIGTTAVLKNALETSLSHLPAEHFVYKIYATAPVTAPLLRKFVSFAESEPKRFSVSVGKFRNPIERAMAIAEGNRLHFREPQYIDSRSQDLRDHFFMLASYILERPRPGRPPNRHYWKIREDSLFQYGRL